MCGLGKFPLSNYQEDALHIIVPEKIAPDFLGNKG